MFSSIVTSKSGMHKLLSFESEHTEHVSHAYVCVLDR